MTEDLAVDAVGHVDVMDVAADLLQRTHDEKDQAHAEDKRSSRRMLYAIFFCNAVILLVVLLVLGHDHAETIAQTTAARNEPAAVSAIIDRAVCPLLKAVSSVHSTALRVALIKKYCG